MRQLKTALVALLLWTIALGGLYPLLVTGFGALFFTNKARGSLVAKNGHIIGSKLLAQEFDGSAYFHPRPSAASYTTVPSGASNLGPTSADLKSAVERRTKDWEAANATAEIPVEMITSSGSGLDPHISPRAAVLQTGRVAAVRGLTPDGERALAELVHRFEEGPQLGFLGERRVNVLELNLALDEEFPR
jgi:potassium-transporting ATPase KdpC subunit